MSFTVTEAKTYDSSADDVYQQPLDAICRRLMFGARKGVSQTVVNWFFAHLEHRLK